MSRKEILTQVPILTLAIALFGGVTAFAQRQGHQLPASPSAAPLVGSQAVSGCPESAQSALQTLDSLRARLEQSRQTNSGADLRNAMDGVQSALDGVRAHVNACAMASGRAQSMDHSKMDHSKMGQEMDHSMDASHDIDPVCAARADSKAAPQVTYQGQTYYFCSETNRQMFLADPARYVKTPGSEKQPSKMPMGGGATAAKPGADTGTKAAAPTAPMDHSKMPMADTSSAKPAKPGAATGAKPPEPEAPIDHSKMPMGGEAQPGKAMDPVSGLMVDPATAAKTTYQGQTYYFSSERTRKEFLENPAKFATKPKR